MQESDNELYKNFNIVISERWQNEISETVFEVVNQVREPDCSLRNRKKWSILL